MTPTHTHHHNTHLIIYVDMPIAIPHDLAVDVSHVWVFHFADIGVCTLPYTVNTFVDTFKRRNPVCLCISFVYYVSTYTYIRM